MALLYFYMVSAWGGNVFIKKLIPLHVFVLLLMGKFSWPIETSFKMPHFWKKNYSEIRQVINCQKTKHSLLLTMTFWLSLINLLLAQ